MWSILKAFIESVTILFAFFFFFLILWVFLAARHVGFNTLTRDQTHIDPAVEGEILTTGPPGKSPIMVYLNEIAFIIKEIENS